MAAGDGAGRGLAAVLSARQMIVDIIGYLLADGRQLKHLIFDDRIVGLLGKLPIHHRLVPQIVRPIHGRTIPMGCASFQG